MSEQLSNGVCHKINRFIRSMQCLYVFRVQESFGSKASQFWIWADLGREMLYNVAKPLLDPSSSGLMPWLPGICLPLTCPVLNAQPLVEFHRLRMSAESKTFGTYLLMKR